MSAYSGPQGKGASKVRALAKRERAEAVNRESRERESRRARGHDFSNPTPAWSRPITAQEACRLWDAFREAGLL